MWASIKQWANVQKSRKKKRNETNNEQTSIAAASSYVKEESYKVNAMMMYFIATYTQAKAEAHATTTSLDSSDLHTYVRDVYTMALASMWRKEERREIELQRRIL